MENKTQTAGKTATESIGVTEMQKIEKGDVISEESAVEMYNTFWESDDTSTTEFQPIESIWDMKEEILDEFEYQGKKYVSWRGQDGEQECEQVIELKEGI